jgi:hypothetical protein
MITHKTSNLVINKDKIPLDTYNYLRGVDADLKNIFQALVEIKNYIIFGTLRGLVIDDAVAIGVDSSTNERGFLMKMLNKTGTTTVKGSIVAASTTTSKAFLLEDTGFDPFGIVYEAGVADGSEAWIWVNGSIAQVLWKNSTASTMGNVALCDDVDGRAYDVAVPTANPVVAEHFREIGHVLQTQANNLTNSLVLCHLHFN